MVLIASTSRGGKGGWTSAAPTRHLSAEFCVVIEAIMTNFKLFVTIMHFWIPYGD
jgi:hypothetical protein